MLDIRDLVHVYADGTRALDGVTLSVRPGLFGLLGPNGAGKSSLMRVLATLQRPTAGNVRFDGGDILADPVTLRRQLGYLPQDFGVYPRVSARRLLDHLAILKGLTDRAERRETVDALLAQVNLWTARDRAVASFSGGMRQRFGIAQALIGDPRLLIVDEPTAGLDPEERNRILNLLAGLGGERVVILSTHIVDDVADLCPAMAVLAGGRVLLHGQTQALIADVRQRVWRRTMTPLEAVAFAERSDVLTTRLVAGQVRVHILADQPPEGWEAAAGDLEDVYFCALAGDRSARAGGPDGGR